MIGVKWPTSNLQDEDIISGISKYFLEYSIQDIFLAILSGSILESDYYVCVCDKHAHSRQSSININNTITLCHRSKIALKKPCHTKLPTRY